MAVRTRRLWSPTAVGTAGGSLFTCPAGTTAIIKSIGVWPQASTVTGVDFFIGAIAAGNHFRHVVCPNSGDVELEGLFWVLQPGDVLRASTGGVGNATIAGFGAQLLGVSP